MSFKDYLFEMSVNIGSSFSTLDEDVSYRESLFAMSEKYTEYKIYNFSKDIKTVFNESSNKTLYFTNDYVDKETIHITSISTMTDKSIPFKFIVQNTVDRVKGVKLPKGFATDFIYNYFKQQSYPLRSSKEQYTKGRDMWGQLVIKALHDNVNAYYFEPNKLIELNPQNYKKYTRDYFGTPEKDFKDKHLFLSKHELKL